MNLNLIIKIALCISSMMGFVYGAFVYYKKKVPLFNQLIVCALGCFMLGRIYDVVYNIVASKTSAFDKLVLPPFLSLLAIIGGFLFILSASYGQMDGLVDDKSKKMMKYRILALIAPVAISLLFIPIALKANTIQIIICALIFFNVMISSYYNFKHLIIPDVDYGIIKSIRPYNILSLVLSILYVTQITFIFVSVSTFYYVISFIMCAIYIIIIPILQKGSKKWTI